MSVFGCIGTVLCLVGVYLVGCRLRYGFMLTAVGELAWAALGWQSGMYDLSAMSLIFLALNVWNYRKWGVEV